MLIFHEIGDWRPDQVEIAWVRSGRKILPPINDRIEQAWEKVMHRPGVHLFDGPMCRLERWNAAKHRLKLFLSRTSYKIFLGTNLETPGLANRYGKKVLANPIGVSPALCSSDGYLLFGRRNGSVAYYPHWLHPFSGAMEPGKNLDVFDEVRRELKEELNLRKKDLPEIRCLGIVEDKTIKHPEMIFSVRANLTRKQIERQLEQVEHSACHAVPANRPALEKALQTKARYTPVAMATLLLWGKGAFGAAWFQQASKRIT